MPTSVLVCDTCGTHYPFLIYEEELTDVQNGKPLSRDCPTCRTKTNWKFAFPERRSGRDRRQSPDRRRS